MRFEKNDSKSWTVTVEDREFPLKMTASSITNKFNRAMRAGAQMLDQQSKTAESGQALETRMGEKTSTLVDTARNQAEGLERALQHAALVVGDNPEEVSVEPNLDFISKL